MDLKREISDVLSLEKFSNLDEKQKDYVSECIFANCLILSDKNKKRFLDLIRNNVKGIQDLGNGEYVENGLVYNGIVQTSVDFGEKDDEIIYKYFVRCKQFKTSIGRLTKSSLHEFGHVAVKKDKMDDSNSMIENDTLYHDYGGLTIGKGLKQDFGHTLTEVMEELTNFWAFKSYLSYREIDEQRLEKMRKYLESRGIGMENNVPHLNILPEDFYTSYTEYHLAHETMPEGTTEMFNPLYVKYTSLARFMLRAFENPMFTWQDSVEAFKNGEGLSAKRNGVPINDLFYGYYEDSLHPKKVFDGLMGEEAKWENICVALDKSIYSKDVDYDLVEGVINTFSTFYERRLAKSHEEGLITDEVMNARREDFEIVKKSCEDFYGINSGRKRT